MTKRARRAGTGLALLLGLAICVPTAALSRPAAAQTLTGAFPTLRYIRSAPDGDAPSLGAINPDTQITVETTGDGAFGLVTFGGVTGYVDMRRFEEQTASAAQTAQSVQTAQTNLANLAYVPAQTRALSLPNAMFGKTLALIMENTLLTPEGEEGGFYRITLDDGTAAYVEKAALQFEPDACPTAYRLVMTLSDYTLRVYEADEKGRSTGTLVREILCAVGKRATPTPTGTFTLTTRQEWHSFTLSYAPFAIEFTKRRYLHGPLYAQTDTATLIESRDGEYGEKTTGGCLRMPYEDILWLYYHIRSGETVLEVRAK